MATANAAELTSGPLAAFSRSAPEIRRLAPGLGADTGEVLAAAGFSEREIACPRAAGRRNLRAAG